SNNGAPAARALGDVRTGLEVEDLKQAIHDNLLYLQGKFPQVATRNDYYMAVAYSVRDRLLRRWINTARTALEERIRPVCCFSGEVLLGTSLGNKLLNVGSENQVRLAVEELGLDWNALIQHEPEPGLGNGGLGRLAACYLDSLATLQIPSIGYGIRYEYG